MGVEIWRIHYYILQVQRSRGCHLTPMEIHQSLKSGKSIKKAKCTVLLGTCSEVDIIIQGAFPIVSIV